MKNSLPIILSAFIIPLTSQHASSESMDYNTLEKLFGEPVTTSITGKPILASKAPASIDILTQEDIQKSGAYDLAGLLKRFAGVEVERHTIGHAEIAIRGYNQADSNQILFLLNGRQIQQDAFSTPVRGVLPVQLSEIRQIEVIKGPASAMYGFNAQSGVINIITYTPLMDDISEIKGTLGNRQYQEGSAVSTVKVNDKFAFRISGGSLSSDGFNRDSLEDKVQKFSSDDAWRKQSYNLDAEYKVSPHTSLRLMSNTATIKMHEVTRFAARANLSRNMVGHHLNIKHAYGKSLFEGDIYRHSVDNTGDLGIETDLTVFKGSAITPISNQITSRVSLEHRYSKGTGNQMGGSDDVFDYNNHAINTMLDWQMSDKLTWVNALRYDYIKYGRNMAPSTGVYTGQIDPFNRLIEETTYNSALVYEHQPHHVYRLSLGRSVHVPGLTEMSAGGWVLGGDPQLQPERLTSLELGYHYNSAAQENEFKASVFWNKMENVLDIYSNGATLLYENDGDSEAYGLELSYSKRKENYDWNVSYTGITLDDAPTNDGIFYESRQPEHQISFVGHIHDDKWTYGGEVHYVSGVNYIMPMTIALPSIQDELLDSYFTVNASANYKLNESTTLSVKGYNLLDKHREMITTDNNALGASSGGVSLGKLITFNITKKF